MDLAVLLLVSRHGEPDATAVWLRMDGNPWRCIECSVSLSWMRKTEVREAHARLARDGYDWQKIEGIVRDLNIRVSC